MPFAVQRARRVAGWPPCLLMLAVALGCTSSPADPEPSKTVRESTSSITPVGFDPPSKLIDHLRALDQSPRTARASALPARLDVNDSRTGPTLAEEPIGRAVLMAQVSIFSTDPAAENLTDGLPYLLSQGGEWRRLDLRDYGFARTYGEMGAALSPDGRHIALNDIGRQTMAVVELATGDVVRHQIPAREAITLKWSPDGRHLSFSDRHRKQAPGWTLNTITGTVVETPYRVWWSEHDAVGNIWELTANGSLRRWRDGQIAATARLDYPDLGRAYPLAAGRLFAVSQFQRKVSSRSAPRGVAVFDPATSDLVRFLRLGARTGWTRPLRWLDADTLLLADGPSGRIWTWKVGAGRTTALARVEPSGLDLRLP